MACTEHSLFPKEQVPASPPHPPPNEVGTIFARAMTFTTAVGSRRAWKTSLKTRKPSSAELDRTPNAAKSDKHRKKAAEQIDPQRLYEAIQHLKKYPKHP